MALKTLFNRKKTPAERVAIRQHFADAAWPVPQGWEVRIDERVTADPYDRNTPKLSIEFYKKQNGRDRYLGFMSVTFNERHAYLGSFSLQEDAQNTGAGRKLAGFLLDELAGQGYKKTTIIAVTWGSYVWLKMGFRPNYMPRNFFKKAQIALNQLPAEHKVEFAKRIGKLSHAYINWRTQLLDFANLNLPIKGNKYGAAKSVLYDSSWRGAFDADDPKCVEQLKKYSGHTFRHL